MDAIAFYEAEAKRKETGACIDGRTEKAAEIFRRHLGTARSLLDIGCGAGTISLYLGRLLAAKEIYGVDISPSRVEAARQKGVKACTVDLNRQGLPFPDSCFDAIFCGEVIEHLFDTDHLLREIHRTLTPTGLCVLTTPNLAMWLNRIALMLGWQPFETAVSLQHEVGRPKFLVSSDGCHGHVQVFTQRALLELLSRHGLRVVAVKGAHLSDVYVDLGEARAKPVRALLYRLLWPVDVALSLVPSLACRLIVAFRKR